MYMFMDVSMYVQYVQYLYSYGVFECHQQTWGMVSLMTNKSNLVYKEMQKSITTEEI